MGDTESGKQEKLRGLPAVDKALADERVKAAAARVHHRIAVRVAREYLDDVRDRIRSADGPGFDGAELAHRLRTHEFPTLTKVVNGLGVVLHTGLGRAPLCEAAREGLADVSNGFSSLEIELESGRRGDRYSHVETLLCELTGAEAAHVVNNNCAATLLILSSMAAGREVIVSRGQLIEIGGAFRIPDVMKQSGCTMVEVGTTNRTHLRDYRNAVTENTAALLRVHMSNYRIRGFTKEVGLAELVELGGETGIPVIDDLGSGALVDLGQFGLPKEPLVQESMQTGAAVACFSGDKLIGAGQAGIIVGKREHIARMKKHPLTRAMRLDKLSFTVLERTLELFLDEPRALEEHVLYRILLKPVEQMQREAQSLSRRVKPKLEGVAEVSVRASESEFGGGSLATESLESRVVTVKPSKMSVDDLARDMRLSRPPVFGRVENDEYLLDFRTLGKDDIPVVADALLSVLGGK